MAALGGTPAVPPFIRNPNHVWWITDTIDGLPVSGPRDYDDYMCESCNNYVTMVEVQLLWQAPVYNLCNYCGAMALMGHNVWWDIAGIYWP